VRTPRRWSRAGACDEPDEADARDWPRGRGLETARRLSAVATAITLVRGSSAVFGARFASSPAPGSRAPGYVTDLVAGAPKGFGTCLFTTHRRGAF
jgi:hypothetical protein